MPTTFAARLKCKRRHDGLSQVALATRLKVDQKMISKYENDRDKPRPDKYETFAEYLEMDVADLADLLHSERADAGVRQPRDPGGVVPGTPAEFEQLRAALTRLGKRVSALGRRVSDLETQVAAQSPLPGPGDLRRTSTKKG